MPDRRHAYIGPDGRLFMLPVLGALVVAVVFGQLVLAVVLLAVLVLLVLLFRDPARRIPSRPRAVLSPVDGRVTAVERMQEGVVDGRPAWRVVIRVDNLGAYSARSPVEGRLLELSGERLSTVARSIGVKRGLWVRDDAGRDVVVVLHALPLLGPPRATVRYGERVGQGQRIAWLRVAREAEVYVGDGGRPQVRTGDRVLAGSSVLLEMAD